MQTRRKHRDPLFLRSCLSPNGALVGESSLFGDKPLLFSHDCLSRRDCLACEIPPSPCDLYILSSSLLLILICSHELFYLKHTVSICLWFKLWLWRVWWWFWCGRLDSCGKFLWFRFNCRGLILKILRRKIFSWHFSPHICLETSSISCFSLPQPPPLFVGLCFCAM